jgi:hypothetical protein
MVEGEWGDETMRTCRFCVLGLLFNVGFFCFPVVLHAENRALLIAASNYPTNISSLRGPGNDVEAIWGLLIERGFKSTNIRVLADGLREEFAKGASVSCGKAASDPGCPTYANVAPALANLTAAAQRGDYVVLYFSGHGVQIPDLVKRDKPDGLTEAFVPLDVGRWDAGRRTVQNLLTSDAVGEAIEKIRAKGAFVWAIFDTCHAGDMVRGATSYAVPRLIRGSVLGIPEEAYVEAKKGKTAAPQKGGSLNVLRSGHADGLVAFYAAQSDQLALEMAFDDQDAAGKPTQLVMGALTNALRRALAQEPDASYRQLAQRIVEIYGNLGADMPAPYFEGALDKPAFSGKAAEPIWQVNGRDGKLMVAAGELNGIGEGAILSLFNAGAAGTSSPALGYARVELATASRSEAVPIAYADKKPLTLAGGERLRARLERPGIRAVLRVALPPAEDGAGTAPERSGRATIEVLRTMAPERRAFSLEWVATGQPADVYLRLREGRIWLLTPFGEWVTTGARQSPSIAVSDTAATAKTLQENLWRLARALNLQRLAGGYRQSVRGIEGVVPKSLNVELFLYRDPRVSATGFACPDAPASQNTPPTGAVRLGADAVPEFRHCDIVYVVMRNTGTHPIDVTLLYIEAEAQIDCFNGWGKARIDPGEVRDRMQGFRIVTKDQKTGAPLPVGRERLMVIGVEKPTRDAIETTFCNLQQKSLDAARAERGSRSATSPFAALMEEAGLATELTRGFTAVRTEDVSSVVMRTFTWDVKDPSKK